MKQGVVDLWAVNDVGVKAISGVRVEQCGECRPSLTVVRRGLSRVDFVDGWVIENRNELLG